MVGCPQGVNDVELAASLLAKDKGMDEAWVGSSDPPRVDFGALPIFESPRSALSLGRDLTADRARVRPEALSVADPPLYGLADHPPPKHDHWC